ncbi:MAG: nuclease A inhibitor family protein [Spirulina sp.]
MTQAISDDSLQADVDRLQTLVADLWYPSETDAPVTIVVWPSPQADDVLELLDTEVSSIPEHPPEQFFQPILKQPFWHSAQGEHLAERYQALEDFLQGILSDLRVYRLGQVEVALYLVGQHPSGAWVGLKTQVVET